MMTFDINEKLPIIRLTKAESDELDLNGHNGLEHLNLPEPSFRKAKNDHYKRTKKVSTERGQSYYHHIEPKPDVLFNRVEYDMDLEDVNWLKIFNETVGSRLNFNVTEADFEKIMDRLEKVSYFANQKSGNNTIPEVDQDAVCAICNDGDCSELNVILFCDMCNLAVHQECYGIPYVPEGQWHCRRCLQSPLNNVKCCLCPNMGGAFKQTDDNRWVHVICALWIPEVCFANTVFLEPVDNIDQIPPARWRLNCYICKQKRNGACIQCHRRECFQPFHVTCAQQAGLYMKIRTHKYVAPDGSTYNDLKKEAFCDVHTPKDAEAGGAMYSGDVSEDDVESEAYKKKDDKRKKQIKKTRKILAEKREVCMKKDTTIRVDQDKLEEISKLFGFRGKAMLARKNIDAIRMEVVDHIHKYWQLKREARSGVPLIRRLQVTFRSNTPKQPEKEKVDADVFCRLRYDLERCRMLLGDLQKREKTKRNVLKLSLEILEHKMKIIDMEHPPERNNNNGR